MSRLLLALLCITSLLAGSSALYFLTLALHLPFAIFMMLMAGWGYGLYRLFKKLPTAESLSENIPVLPAIAMLAAALRMLWVSSRYYIPYGEWDALAMWNYHARFLSEPRHWQQLYHTMSFDHTDYPQGLPGIIAIWWRGGNTISPIIPLIISWWIMLATPLMIFCVIARKNLILGLAVLLYFCTSESYLHKGISGYADTLLSLLFLSTIVAADHFRKTGNPRWLCVCGLSAAAAIWTKNEGIMLATLFVFFNLRIFLSRKNITAFCAGLMLSLAAWLAHKICFASGNDLVSSTHSSSLQLLWQKSRLVTILRFFKELMWEWFRPIIFIVAGYTIWCVIYRRSPSRNFMIVLACLAGYIGVYMLTPYSLDWHLSTSMDRLVHQLVPALLYAVGAHLAGDRPRGEKAQSTSLAIS